MWPDGKRAAAAFTFDFDAEEVWIGEDPENANRPACSRRAPTARRWRCR